LRAKKGNKVSRAFRFIFENSKIKKILGMNLAAALLATNLFQFPAAISESEEQEFLTKAPFVLETKSGIQYPVKNVKMTQGYRFYHPGIDLDGLTGDSIYPFMGGKVQAINYSRVGYGNAILIYHGDGITSLYAHLSKILVEPNEEVTLDTQIGKMGATGRASGDHLHFEIRDNGKPVNPLTVLAK